MKKRLALLLAVISAVCFFAFRQTAESSQIDSVKNQKEFFSELRPQSVQASGFGVSVPVSELRPRSRKSAKPAASSDARREQARAVPNIKLRFANKSPARRRTTNRLWRASPSSKCRASLSFEGISSNDNAAAHGFRIVPRTRTAMSAESLRPVGQRADAYFRQKRHALTPPFKLMRCFPCSETPVLDARRRRPIVLYDTRRPLVPEPVLQ